MGRGTGNRGRGRRGSLRSLLPLVEVLCEVLYAVKRKFLNGGGGGGGGGGLARWECNFSVKLAVFTTATTSVVCAFIDRSTLYIKRPIVVFPTTLKVLSVLSSMGQQYK